MSQTINKALFVSLLALSSSYPVLAEADNVAQNTEITIPATPESSLADLQKTLVKQLRGLAVAKETLIEILELQNPSLESKVLSIAQWIDDQLERSPADDAQSIQTTLLMHSTIAEYFSKLLNSPQGEFDSLDPKKMWAEHSQVPQQTVSTLETFVPTINNQINGLLNGLTKTLHEILSSIITQQRTQLQGLQDILQLIINKLNNNSKLANKSVIKEQIAELRNQIQQAYQIINQQPLSPLLVKRLHSFIKAITQHLDTHAAQIHHLMPLSDETVTRSLENEPDLPTIVKEMEEIKTRIAHVEELADKADLSWTEKTARTLSDYVISPLYRHRYPIMLAGTSAVAIAAAWYYFGFEGGRLGKWLREAKPGWLSTPIFGDHIDHESNFFLNHGKQVAEEAAKVPAQAKINPGLIGRMERFWAQLEHRNLPFLASVVSACGYTFNKTWKHYELGKTCKNLLNRLKGGSYRKQALKQEYALAPITFDNVIGMDHAKEEMLKVFNYLQNPERWDAADIKVTTSILLTGKTRSGKTHFANAIRGEANERLAGKVNFQFREISHEDVREYGIKTIMEMAKIYWAPCILFIDEIHLLGLQDTGNPGIYNDFLTALSGIDTPDPKRPVILIAATNKPENLGKALRQKGRFGLEIRFEYPSVAERKAFIAKRLKHYAIDPESFGIDLDSLARQTENCTYEMINSVISVAFIQINLHGGVMDQKVLEHAIDTEIRKIIFAENREIPEKEQRLLSAFWSGFALAAHELGLHKTISRLTTRPFTTELKEEMLGSDLFFPEEYNKQAEIARGNVWTYHNHDTLGFETNEQRITEVKVMLAARAAERELMGTNSVYWQSSRQRAFEIIKSVIGGGIDYTKLPQKAQEQLVEKAHAQLVEYEQEVAELMRSKKDILEALANVLYYRQTLSGQEIDYVIEKVKKNGPDEFTQIKPAPTQQASDSEFDYLSAIDSAYSQQGN